MIRTSAQPKDHFEGRWKKGKKYTLYAVVVNNGTKFRSVTPKEKDDPYVIYNSETETFSANAGWEIVEMSEDSRLSAMGGNGGGGHVTAESIRTALGFTPIGESAISNLADEEDFESFEQNGTTKMRLKDRAYSVQQPNGLGYKILRKDATFASQVTDTNTIYEIRYNFDLNNTTVTIPSGCVLKFNGGLLSNGIVNAAELKIEASCKVFENVRFTGDCIYTTVIPLYTFVTKFAASASDSSVDNTQEIQSCLDCGCKNIMFPGDKFLRITQTLVVNQNDVNLLCDRGRKYQTLYRVTADEEPCLFSTNVVTLLHYKYYSSNYRNTLKIGNICFACFKNYTDLSEKDTPIVKIESYGSALWGVQLDMAIKSEDKEISIDGVSAHRANFTGLEISSTLNPISFVRITGYIAIVYNAIRLKRGQGWFTDVTISADTYAVHGCVADDDTGTPIKISGSHQPMPQLADNSKEGYFCGSWINFEQGFVWDLNVHDDRGYSVPYPVKITQVAGHFNEVVIHGQEPFYSDAITLYDDRGIAKSKNLLTTLNSYGNNSLYEDKVDYYYRLNGTSVYDFTNIYNIDRLFGDWSYYNTHGQFTSAIAQRVCYISGNPTSIDTIDVGWVLRAASVFDNDNPPKYLYLAMGLASTTIRVKVYGNSSNNFGEDSGKVEVTNQTIVTDAIYWKGSFLRISIGETFYNYYKFEVTITLSGLTDFALPAIILPCANMDYTIYAAPTARRPKFPWDRGHGFTMLDTTLHKLITYFADSWYDAAGTVV